MRKKILETAIAYTCGERDDAYGPPVQNLSVIAEMWSVYLQRKHNVDLVLTAEDVAWMNVQTKIARSFQSYKEDNYIDAAAYAAIAGECSAPEEDDDLTTFHRLAHHDELSDPKVKQR